MKLRKRYPLQGEREKLIRLIRYALAVHPLKSPHDWRVQAGTDRSEVLVLDTRPPLADHPRALGERVLHLTATKKNGQKNSRSWTLWYSYQEATYASPGADYHDERLGVYDYIGDVARAAALWPEARYIEDAIDVRLQDEFERFLHAERDAASKAENPR